MKSGCQISVIGRIIKMREKFARELMFLCNLNMVKSFVCSLNSI